MDTVTQIIVFTIVGLVAIVGLCIGLKFIDRHYKIKYDYTLYWGGALMLFAIGGIVLFALLLKSALPVAMIGIAVAVVAIVITYLINMKFCGPVGALLALPLQLLFSIPALLFLLAVASKNHYQISQGLRVSRREAEYIKKQKELKGYDVPYKERVKREKALKNGTLQGETVEAVDIVKIDNANETVTEIKIDVFEEDFAKSDKVDDTETSDNNNAAAKDNSDNK